MKVLLAGKSKKRRNLSTSESKRFFGIQTQRLFLYKNLYIKNIRVDGVGKAVYCCAGDSHSAVINEAGEVKYLISHKHVLSIFYLKIYII